MKSSSVEAHPVKVKNCPHTNIILKPEIMWGGEYECRLFKMHLKLRDQQLQTILYIYIYTHTHTHIYIYIYIYTATPKPHGNHKPKILNRCTHKK